MGESNASIAHDINRAVHDLRDKFKHGHHVIKILESQLETARQNISLLQGQIRLANETIDNLKQQFNEADMTLVYLTDNYKGNSERRSDPGRREIDDYAQGAVYVTRNEENESHTRAMEYEKHSPKGVSVIPKSDQVAISETDRAEQTKSPTSLEKVGYTHERPKSPYAQQLRQVLDALQDEDSRKVNTSVSQEPRREANTTSHSQPQVCDCPECVPSSSGHRHYQSNPVVRSSSCGCEYAGNEIHYHSECNKHGGKAIVRSSEGSPMNRPNSRNISHHESATTSHITSVSHSSHQVDYTSQCTGPCCSSIDLSKGYKIVEKSPGMPHYIAPRSPRRHKQHEIRHEPHCQMVGHCDDKCRCHTFVNYAPFGYQVLESAPGVPQTIQPISPGVLSKKNKRFLPLAPGDEPPHLKYTKVKRIDGSKVAAQKTIQDFSKRRLQPYNPRWDLDLLIVPPPMPASELFAALGLEQEASIQQGQEHVSRENCISSDTLTTENRSFDSPLLKSKVINAGGTVIVLTENETESRPVVTHTIPFVDQMDPAVQHAPSFLSPASQKDGQQQSPKADENQSLSVVHEIKKESSIDDEDNMQMETGDGSMEHAEFQMDTSSGTLMGNKEQSSEMSMVKSHPSELAHASLILNSGPLGSGYSEPALRSKSQVKINMKTERNNNSYTKRTFANLVSKESADGHEETLLSGTSNLTSRYEKVLFQRSQDYSRLTTDDEYVLINRAKGKVH